MKKKLIGIIIILLLVVIFTLQNTDVAPVRFLFWKFNTSRALLIAVTLAIGMVSGFSLALLRRK